ncbi:MAG: hypothetical protein WCI79_03490 [Candidatus Saccharibacteria bacterium]
MNKIQRTNQGGSIVLFIIVSVILAIGLVIAVYFLKQRGEQARRDQAIAIVDQQLEAERTKTTEKAVEQAPPVESGANGPENNAPVVVEVASTDDLPATGPELVVGELVGAGMLTFFSASYIASRRKSVSLFDL